MKLIVNGRYYEVDETRPRNLLWVLRHDLGFTNLKYSCGAGICETCTVLVDGRQVRSCVTPLAAVKNADIRLVDD